MPTTLILKGACISKEASQSSSWDVAPPEIRAACQVAAAKLKQARTDQQRALLPPLLAAAATVGADGGLEMRLSPVQMQELYDKAGVTRYSAVAPTSPRAIHFPNSEAWRELWPSKPTPAPPPATPIAPPPATPTAPNAPPPATRTAPNAPPPATPTPDAPPNAAQPPANQNRQQPKVPKAPSKASAPKQRAPSKAMAKNARKKNAAQPAQPAHATRGVRQPTPDAAPKAPCQTGRQIRERKPNSKYFNE